VELVVVFLPVAAQLKIKLLALAAGAKKAQLALPKQTQAATG
jgi:prolyl-tRNA editing enzyme YbaK/EbsC (Cys-tRNA(Pro) deacylase)